jgi:ligand-binding sensor domain-containing protein/signal transduction histidine kinase
MVQIRNHSILFIACSVFSCAAIGQIGTLKFDQISLEQGLSQSTVNAIVQDGLGFMWFGTQDGLNRYDGYSFAIYKQTLTDSTSLSDNGIWSLCRDSSGDIWIGTTRGGLNRYHTARGLFTHYTHDSHDSTSISDNNITSVFQDSRGIVWAGTLTGGVNLLAPGKRSFARLSHIPFDSTSLADNAVWAVSEDRSGVIWIATWGGLCRYNPSPRETTEPGSGSLRRYSHDPHRQETIASNRIRTILAGQDGRIWIGTWGQGLDCLDARTGVIAHYTASSPAPHRLSSNLILSLHEDTHGTLWIGTGDAGLNCLDLHTGAIKQFSHVPNQARSLNNDIICSLYEDKSGILWIGTGAGGINVFDRLRNRFPHFQSMDHTQEGLSGNDVWSLVEDPGGSIWIGTYGAGLNRFDRSSGVFTHYQNNPRVPTSLAHNNVISLTVSRTGELWVGTEGGGLDRLNVARGTFTHYRHVPHDTNSLVQNEITALHEDAEGNLWIGTNGGGLDKLDRARKTFIHFAPDETSPTALPAGTVLALCEDASGYLWVGTYGGGLARLDPATDKFQRYQSVAGQANCLNNNTVLSLYADPSGTLWVGTYNGGLNEFDRKADTWRHYTESDGLPNNVIYGILPDQKGRLWLPTNKGLARFTPATGEVRVFDVTDGLQGNEFNQGASYRSRSGMMYLGGINGFNAFFPDSVCDNPHVPAVFLTSLRVFDRAVPLPQALSTTNAITLQHDQNFLSFEYVALGFTVPAKNQYRYMLEGLDKSWIDAGHRRYASYTNLDPGIYTLRICASNNDGIWNDTGTSMAITIVPPYWRTWWFRVAVVAVLAAILLLMYRYRVRKLLEIERIRTSIATDLHDDIGSTLTEIALFSDVGAREVKSKLPSSMLTEEDRTRLISLFSDTGSTARSLIDAMNDIVWAVDPKNDSFEFLLLRMKMHAVKMLEAKGINYEINIPSELASLRLPLGMRRRLFLIFKEAINNILRHAHPTRVILTMRREGHNLIMTMADNGIGFDPGSGSRGNGLHNMEERARSIGGELSITSARGVGTTITLHSPIP